AGGMTSDLMRESIRESRIVRPAAETYLKPAPARRRRMPGFSSETYFSCAALAACLDSWRSFSEIAAGTFSEVQELYQRGWQCHLSDTAGGSARGARRGGLVCVGNLQHR